MRMWMVDPKIMCRQHLLGEHVECHMFAGTLAKGKSIQGYLDKGLVEVGSLSSRHDDLAKEMAWRGYSHNSPMPVIHCPEMGSVDEICSLKDLLGRCPECMARFQAVMGDKCLLSSKL